VVLRLRLRVRQHLYNKINFISIYLIIKNDNKNKLNEKNILLKNTLKTVSNLYFPIHVLLQLFIDFCYYFLRFTAMVLKFSLRTGNLNLGLIETISLFSTHRFAFEIRYIFQQRIISLGKRLFDCKSAVPQYFCKIVKTAQNGPPQFIQYRYSGTRYNQNRKGPQKPCRLWRGWLSRVSLYTVFIQVNTILDGWSALNLPPSHSLYKVGVKFAIRYWFATLG